MIMVFNEDFNDDFLKQLTRFLITLIQQSISKMITISPMRQSIGIIELVRNEIILERKDKT